jgi:hypothetical protein
VTGASAGEIVTIVRDVPVSRTTDFPISGPFNVDALNTDLDRLTAMVQQQETLDTRSLRIDQFDTPNSLNALPVKASRQGRVLAFNASTGQPEAGPTIAAVQSVSDASADIDTVATNIASVNTVAGDISNVNTVAGVSGNVTTVAGSIANVNAVGSDLLEPVSEINTVALSIANVDAVGGSIANVNTVAGQISPTNNISTVASNAADISTVAGAITNVNTVATNVASVNTNATNIASINTNATNIVAIQNASSNASAAAASASAAAASYDAFDDRYLGAKSSDPSVDNDGNALLTGAIYFNTTSLTWRVWNGAAWDNGVTNVSGFMPLAGGTFTGQVTHSDAVFSTLQSIVSVDTASAAMRIDQRGSGDALLIQDQNDPDPTPFVIDANGRVLSGAPTSSTTGAGAHQVQIYGGTVPLSLIRSAASSTAINLEFAKARGGGIPGSAVVSGDTIGRLYFSGSDGTAMVPAAYIDATVDGTPGTNDMPGRLVFSTTADGASSPSERMRIDNAGRVNIGLAGSSSRGVGIGVIGSTSSPSALVVTPTVPSTATGSSIIVDTLGTTLEAGLTASALYHYRARPADTFGAGATLTDQYGYFADSRITQATNNYGFYSNIASGTGRWNFYAAGTADNYFAGQVQLGAGTAAAPALSTTGDTNTGIFFPAADTVAISAAGTEDFRIGPAGQIGLQGANYGTSGQILTSNGASSAPSWQAAPAGGFSNMQVFTSSGSWTVPAGITKAKVTVIGGGGGGGGGKGAYGGNGNGGRGAGGGGAQRLVTGLTPGSSITVTVGTGGGGGASNNQSNLNSASSGGTGNTSSFGAFCSATGGTGGGGGGAQNAGCGTITVPGSDSLTGGIGSSGDLNAPGYQTAAFGLGSPNPNYGSGQTGRGYGGGGGGGTGPSPLTAGSAGSSGVVIVEW